MVWYLILIYYSPLIYHPQQVLEDINSQLGYQSHNYNSSDNAELNIEQENLSQSSHSINTDNISIAAVGHAPQSNLKSSSNAIVIPEHLTQVYEQLDWHGQDLDALLSTTNLTPPQLIGQLMELELLGVISVQGGRYLRV